MMHETEDCISRSQLQGELDALRDFYEGTYCGVDEEPVCGKCCKCAEARGAAKEIAKAEAGRKSLLEMIEHREVALSGAHGSNLTKFPEMKAFVERVISDGHEKSLLDYVCSHGQKLGKRAREKEDK